MMNKRLISGFLALCLLYVLPQHQALAASAPRVVEVEVSERGWNGSPDAVFTVEEGEMVEFRFTYGDGHLKEDNPHVMTVEGTSVDSELLNRVNPVALLRFRPEKVGTYTLACKYNCVGHERLTAGKVRVVAAGTAVGGLEPEATAVALRTVPPAEPGGQAELHATLASAAGTPLEGVMVEFSVRTTFLISDWMVVGQARTNAGGEAVLRFTPNRGGDQTIRALYPGSGRYLGSEKLMNLAAPPMETVYQSEGSLRLPGIGFWLLWLIVGGIWATYLVVFYHLRQMAIDR